MRSPGSEAARPGAVLVLLLVAAGATAMVSRASSASGHALSGFAPGFRIFMLALFGLSMLLAVVILVAVVRAVLQRRKGAEGANKRVAQGLQLGWLTKVVLLSVVLALIACAVTLIFVIADWYSSRQPKTGTVTGVGHPRPPMPIRQQGAAASSSGGSSELIVAGIVIVALLAASGLAYLVHRRRVRAELAQPDEREQTRHRLADALRGAEQALSTGRTPREAIIACYRSMEDGLGSAGVGRLAADTPEELLARAADTGLVVPTAAWQLAELFGEARFSTHPMSAAQQDRAAAALRELRTVLVAT